MRERVSGEREEEENNETGTHSLIKFCSLVFTDFCVVSIISCENSAGQICYSAQSERAHTMRCGFLTSSLMWVVLQEEEEEEGQTGRLTPCASKMSASFSENLFKHFCEIRRPTLDADISS